RKILLNYTLPDRIPTDIEILTASVAALHVKKDDEVQKSSANKSNVMNHERSTQWENDESAVIYWLRRCCENDLDIIEENDTLKQIWDSLYRKYSKLEREITSFNREVQAPRKSPEECFNRLKVLRHRYLLLKPEKKKSLRNEDLNRARGYRCYVCKLEEHRVDTCQYKERAYEWAFQLRLKEEKVSTRSSKSFKHPSTRNDPVKVANSRRTQLNHPKVKRTAYVAQDIDSESENETVEEEGMMAYSDEKTCGKPRNSSILPTWHEDTAVSSHTTDDPKNLRGPLRPTRRVIKVGGGKLICTEMRDAFMVTENGNAILKDCLLVPGLGANLISVRKACVHAGLNGVFDARAISLSPAIKSEIALQSQNLKSCFEVNSVPSNFSNNNSQQSDQIQGTTATKMDDTRAVWTRKEIMHKNKMNKFKLMHRRLGYVGSAALSKVHNVTTLIKPISVPQMIPKCEVCVKANIKKRFSKRLSPHKSKRLAVLGVDIAGPFPVSVRGNSYFAEIVDNWSRKVCIILLSHKSELSQKLNELSIMFENQSGETILAGRSDGAAEILKIFGEWKSKKGVVPQTTAPYSSHQNGVVERAIQASENEARVLLEDSKMPVEFWDYAVESGAYVRNRLQRGSSTF
ncbi:hypothetical protein EPUL_005219, partial [Erysiphe pulchra]